MTMPYERTRAMIETKTFLQDLLSSSTTPRVPKSVREMARTLLRHYPSHADIQMAHKALPDWFGPVPPFSRLAGNSQTTGVIAATKSGEQNDNKT